MSWGAKLAYLAAATWPGEMSGLALVVPGLRPRIRMPVLDQLRVVLLAFLGGRFPVDIPLEDPSLFSSIPRYQEQVATDPLALRRGTARFLLVSRMIDARIQRLQRGLDPGLDVLLVLAEGDRIVDNEATEAFLRWRAGARLQALRCPTAAHTPEFSEDRILYQERLSGFCLECARS